MYITGLNCELNITSKTKWHATSVFLVCARINSQQWKNCYLIIVSNMLW